LSAITADYGETGVGCDQRIAASSEFKTHDGSPTRFFGTIAARRTDNDRAAVGNKKGALKFRAPRDLNEMKHSQH
jgi:hypothetical protein